MKVILSFFKRKLIYFLSSPIAIFSLIVLKVLSPFIFIRFGKIRSDRIGHFVADSCLIYYEKKQYNTNTFDIYCLSHKPVNDYWCDYISKILNINFIAKLFFPINLVFPKSKHIIYKNDGEKNSSLDKKHFLQRYPSMIEFSKTENDNAWKQLIKLGINKKVKFVCYQVRNSQYLEKKFPNVDFSYHNDRNANIENYLLSMNWLASKGYVIFRMGTTSDTSFIKNKHKLAPFNKQIIDYSNSLYKSDFLDVWLLSNCEFCVTTGSGIDEVAVWSKKPILFTNCTTPFGTWPSSDILCGLKYFYKDKKRVSFKTYLDSDFFSPKDFENKGIKIKDMNEKDILETIKEFYDLFFNNGFYLNFKKNNDLLIEMQNHRNFKNRTPLNLQNHCDVYNSFAKKNFSKLKFSKNFIKWLN